MIETGIYKADGREDIQVIDNGTGSNQGDRDEYVTWVHVSYPHNPHVTHYLGLQKYLSFHGYKLVEKITSWPDDRFQTRVYLDKQGHWQHEIVQ